MMRSKQQSEPSSILSDPSDDGSPNPRRIRLESPSSPGAENSGNQSSAAPHTVETETVACDSCIEKAIAPKETESDPMLLSSEDSNVKNSAVVDSATSVHEVCPSGDVVNPVNSVAEPCPTDDCSRTEKKDSCSRPEDGISDSDVGSVGSKLTTSSTAGDSSFVMVCDVTVRKVDVVKLEMVWIDGPNREVMHQLMQFFRNHLI